MACLPDLWWALRHPSSDRTHQTTGSGPGAWISSRPNNPPAKALCLLDSRPRRRTAKIDPAKLIVAADQVVQFTRPIHAGMPRPTPTKEETAGRLAGGTIRPAKHNWDNRSSVRRGGSVSDPQSPMDAVGNAVMSNPRLASRE